MLVAVHEQDRLAVPARPFGDASADLGEARGLGGLGLHQQEYAGSVGALGGGKSGVDPVECGGLACLELGQPQVRPVPTGQL